jgi:cobalt/nickel transport system permease protein
VRAFRRGDFHYSVQAAGRSEKEQTGGMTENKPGIPAWLRAEENYLPQNGGDGFINKTVAAILKLIAALRAQDVIEQTGRSGADAFWRLILTLVIIVLLSLTREFVFVFIVLTVLLLRLCILPLSDLRKVAAIALIAGCFSFIIMLPSAVYGSSYSLTMLPAKTVASVLAVGILACTSRWSGIVHALSRVRVPGTLIFIVDITLKYLFLLGEFALESMRALKLRSVGVNKRKYGSIAGIAGNLFLRSRFLADEMYGAMICRGFTGTYPVKGRPGFAPADICYIAAGFAFIILFFLLSPDIS